ncbi:MAG: 2-phospho-L-lactate guanylyltransferase [Actinomycetales bacterium]
MTDRGAQAGSGGLADPSAANPPLAQGGWSVVVPVKVIRSAKSRLALPPRDRERLALAFVTDTLSALASSPAVSSLIVVTNDAAVRDVARSLDADVVTETAPPAAAVARDPASPADPLTGSPASALNAAIRSGLAHVREREQGVAVVLGDLPALRSTEVTELLTRVSEQQERAAHDGEHDVRLVVPDADGTGSTALLAARAGSLPTPAFGPASAAAHRRAGAAAATWAPIRWRQDVDTLADLQTACRLGVGPATTAALSSVALPSWHAGTVLRRQEAGGVVLDDGRLVPSALPASARPGQRVFVAVDENGKAVDVCLP